MEKRRRIEEVENVAWGYDGEIWEDSKKRKYSSNFKTQVVALYKNLKNSAMTVAAVNRTIKGEASINGAMIKRWDLEIKHTKPHISAALEEEAGQMRSVYKEIHDSAIQHTKTIVDEIPTKTKDMDALDLSRTALNLASLAEKMDIIDPDGKEIVGGEELLVQMTKEEKISFILRYKDTLPEDVVKKIDGVLSSKLDKLTN